MQSCRRAITVAIVATLVLAACGGGSGTTGNTDQLTVFAASSLTEAFTALADAYAAEHPDVDPVLTFASSSDLARQITEGAGADVFAVADLANMAKVTDAGLTDGEPEIFATNRAEIVVAPGNPLGITGVEGLAADDLVVVVCAPEAPCGKYAAEVFANAGVEVTPDSLEENVKAVVTKVTLGEADAGIVYVTDILAAGDTATGVVIGDDVNVVAEYPIAAIGDAPAPARDFIDFVLGPQGQAILERFGFGAP
jgi:molybdate transport system substrate-binding protein